MFQTKKSSRKWSGKIQNIYVILNFPALDFLVSKIKERELKKNSVVLYPIFIHTLLGRNLRNYQHNSATLLIYLSLFTKNIKQTSLINPTYYCES